MGEACLPWNVWKHSGAQDEAVPGPSGIRGRGGQLDGELPVLTDTGCRQAVELRGSSSFLMRNSCPPPSTQGYGERSVGNLREGLQSYSGEGSPHLPSQGTLGVYWLKEKLWEVSFSRNNCLLWFTHTHTWPWLMLFALPCLADRLMPFVLYLALSLSSAFCLALQAAFCLMLWFCLVDSLSQVDWTWDPGPHPEYAPTLWTSFVTYGLLFGGLRVATFRLAWGGGLPVIGGLFAGQ